MTTSLPPTIRSGIVNRSGHTPESQKTIERLLEEDREKHHCYFNEIGFHNHLSHHLLAAYDLGATAKLLQVIYDDAQDGIKLLKPINWKTSTPPAVTEKDWTEHLLDYNYYKGYLDFFTASIASIGVTETLDKYVFSPAANGNGAEMFARFMGGAVHPFIQTGYAAEFGSDAMIAQGLAMTAMTQPFVPGLFNPTEKPAEPPLSALQILRAVYDSDILAPVMPYDPDALLSKRTVDAATEERISAIRALVARWFAKDEGTSKIVQKHAETMWLATLLLAGTSKRGKLPRLDFFLMHVLNSSLFTPSLLSLVKREADRVRLVEGFLAMALFIVIVRGRPRVDVPLIMSYTAFPAPLNRPQLAPTKDAVGDPNVEGFVNPWDFIVPSVLHDPDAHSIKAIRALYYASVHFGTTPAGAAPGAVDEKGQEALEGAKELDGSVFVRAAGVVMDVLGWVTHGQENGIGHWDRSALGWDDAWKGDETKYP